MAPRTRYAKFGDLSIAYQVVGEGPIDVVFVPSFVSHLEFLWADPVVKAWLDRLASFTRLILFDKLGTGMSDPVHGIPSLEERAGEIQAVIDAAGATQPALFGLSEGGPASIFFAATQADRVRALVLFGTYPRGAPSLDANVREYRQQLLADGWDEKHVPSERQIERVNAFGRHVHDHWGDGQALSLLVPSLGSHQQLALAERVTASPGMARATLESGRRLDVSHLLRSVRVPTLVVHARDDIVPVQLGRLLADSIPGARLLEVEGSDHAPWFTEPDVIASEVEQFLTGARGNHGGERVLTTVLFTDIVSSTSRAAALGDARWRAVLERHTEIARSELGRSGGRVVKSTGDGVLATLDGPARAIRCAEALVDAVKPLGIELRAGVHTGECEVIGNDVGGLAVHIAARVCDAAEANEVLVSRTVRDLVVGSGVGLSDRGVHELKGVPGEWQLLAVSRPGTTTEDHAAVTAIETPSPRESMRPTDRVALMLARRSPGLLRAFARTRRSGSTSGAAEQIDAP